MNYVPMPNVVVGNEFLLQPKPEVVIEPSAPIAPEPIISQPVRTFEPLARQESIPIIGTSQLSFKSLFTNFLDLLHRNSVITFALLVLLCGTVGIKVVAGYWSAESLAGIKPAAAIKVTAPTIAGLNLAVPTSQLPATIQKITNQPATLSVGSQSQTISPATIKSWLTITANPTGTTSYIHVNSKTIASSLIALADQYVVSPVNQVSVTHTDGVTPSGVIINGKNGTSLSDPNSLSEQASTAAKSIMNGNGGLKFSTALQVLPFQNVTPSAFGKLLEVDLTTKRMYAYQNGQLVNTFLVSAGKPSTPTPVGEFKIWDKETSQTMTGPGYVQPNVPWVNYFDHSGDAVHGVYWRPASVFGNINTSHGCVGVQVSQAEWIYNWAPIGTTVITYT